MNNKGFLQVPNSYFESKLWTDKFKSKLDKGDAMLDILNQVRYGKGSYKMDVNGVVITINKGEMVASYSYLSKRWKWNKGTVYRFINELKRDNIISTRKEKGVTIIAVTTMNIDVTANATDNYTDNQAVTGSSATPNATNKNTVINNTYNIVSIDMINSTIEINKEWLSQPIADRHKLFKQIISERYMDKYDLAMIKEFVMYWAYFEEGDQTMRFEEVKGKKFHMGRRLGTWSIGYNKFAKSKKKSYISDYNNQNNDYNERL